MLMTEKGMVVRSPIKDIRSTGRSTQGVRLIKLEAGDKVATLAKIVPEDEDEKIEAAAKLAPKSTEPIAVEKAKEPEVRAEAKTEVKAEDKKAKKPEAKVKKAKTPKPDKVNRVRRK